MRILKRIFLLKKLLSTKQRTSGKYSVGIPDVNFANRNDMFSVLRRCLYFVKIIEEHLKRRWSILQVQDYLFDGARYLCKYRKCLKGNNELAKACLITCCCKVNKHLSSWQMKKLTYLLRKRDYLLIWISRNFVF